MSALLTTFQDDFSDSSLDTAKWTITNGTHSETGGSLTVNTANGQANNLTHNYTNYPGFEGTNSSVAMKISNWGTPNANWQPYFYFGNGNTATYPDWSYYFYYEIRVINGVLSFAEFDYDISAYTVLSSVTYNATDHAWFRYRIAGTTIYLEYASSSSGLWITAYSDTISGKPTDECYFGLSMDSANTSGISQSFTVDDVNTNVPPPPSLMQTFQDDFADNSFDTSKWTLYGGSASETGGSLTLTVPNTENTSLVHDYPTYLGFEAMNSYVAAKISDWGTGHANWQPYFATGNGNAISYATSLQYYFMITVINGTLSFVSYDATTTTYTTLSSVTYSATDHAWFRFRFTSSNINIEHASSATGLWTTAHTVSISGKPTDNAYFSFGALTNNSGSSKSFTIDEVNTNLPVPVLLDYVDVQGLVNVWDGDQWGARAVKSSNSGWSLRNTKHWNGTNWVLIEDDL